MEQAVNLAVPLVADACAGKTWYDAKGWRHAGQRKRDRMLPRLRRPSCVLLPPGSPQLKSAGKTAIMN